MHMSFTNFAALQSLTSVGGTDQFLVSLDNGLSGADGFGRVTTEAMNKSLGVYSTVQANSAQWATDNTTDTGVRALTGNWQNTYSTVNTTSASWLQTLSFNASNAQLSISNGNTISLSSLSAAPGLGGGSGLTIFREVSSTVSPNNTTIVHALSVNSLSANVDIVIAARGNGATLAQIPNLSASGGNKRGQYATDWQKLRASSSQVASGIYSTIGGGRANTALSDSTTVAGGHNNNAGNSYATVAGGYNNNVGGNGATIAGGYSNQAAGSYATIAGGTSNAANNSYNTIGGGVSNNASSAAYATIAGGYNNNAAGTAATIAGGSSNYAGQTYTTIPGGYGAYAHKHGQYAYASHYFAGQGDGQHFQYVLYGTSVDGVAVVLSPNGANYPTSSPDIPSLFVDDQNMVAILTIQVIGFDDAGNYSHSLKKVVVRKIAASYNEELLVNTTVGTNGTDAGTFAFEINTNTSPNVFTVVGYSNSGDQTRWVAHVSGTWVYQPPAYP
jgi:hypothetical protein